jgi:polysaccharide biosynthesis protein PslG
VISLYPRSIRPSRLAALGVSLVLAGSLLPAATAEAAAPSPVTSRFFGASDRLPGGTTASGFPNGPVGALRLWDSGVSWRELETKPGVFSFAYLDSLVATARKHGAKPMLVLGQTPRFHASHPTWAGAYGKGAATMPDLAAWKRYVATVAQRYGNAIDYQVWNEPNVIGYWRGSPAQMATLTRTARAVLDKWAPAATVVAPSFPVRLAAQRSWIGRYYASKTGGHKVASYVDVVSLNLYPPRVGGPEASMSLLAEMRRILAADGVHKPIWNTEINYGLIGNGKNAAKISVRRQAANVTRTFVLNAANRIQRVYWYAWDLHGIGNTDLTARNNATLTRAGVAYRVVSSWLKGGRVSACSVGSSGAYTCTVRYSGGVKRIYWDPSGRTTIRAMGSATYTEGMLGMRRTLHGGEHLSVGYAPILVRSTH